MSIPLKPQVCYPIKLGVASSKGSKMSQCYSLTLLCRNTFLDQVHVSDTQYFHYS